MNPDDNTVSQPVTCHLAQLRARNMKAGYINCFGAAAAVSRTDLSGLVSRGSDPSPWAAWFFISRFQSVVVHKGKVPCHEGMLGF